MSYSVPPAVTFHSTRRGRVARDNPLRSYSSVHNAVYNAVNALPVAAAYMFGTNRRYIDGS